MSLADASRRMPVAFAAHGAPILLDDEQWMSALAAWALAMLPGSVLPDQVPMSRRPQPGRSRS